jgi:glycosyltransferase involved in cell wall biosynthesis
MIHPVLYDDLALPVLQAMRSDVPVVASAVGSLPAICGTAALYCDPADVNSIAENMMLVFKDEQKAASLILAGKAVMQQYSWENSADQLMALIDKAATK